MQLLYFTKYDPDSSVEQLGQKARRLGVDGLDLAVRPGQQISPDNVVQALPAAVKVWQKQQVVCGLVTAPTDLVDPQSPAAEAIFAACGQAGVRLVKIGYWRYEPGQDYWRQVDLIRSALEGFSRLGQRHGVTACYHTHSGGFYGSSCGALMHLLRGFDPKLVGAYLDTGHLAVEGEDFTMGLAMVGPYLAAVAAKDLRKVPDENTDPPTWSRKHVKLGEGFFNWRQGLEALRAAGFSGPLSIHGEYEQLDQATRARWLAEDVELIKSVLGRLEQRRRA